MKVYETQSTQSGDLRSAWALGDPRPADRFVFATHRSRLVARPGISSFRQHEDHGDGQGLHVDRESRPFSTHERFQSATRPEITPGKVAVPNRFWRSERSPTTSFSCYSRGKVKKNAVPLPNSLFAQTLPPWLCTMCLTIDNPSPVPPCSRDRALSTR
jgi:hypothetical protein